MSITRTGIKLSKNATWGDSDDLDFHVDQGGLGTWQFQATGLDSATSYNIKGYIIKDGNTIESTVDSFTTTMPNYLTFLNSNNSDVNLSLTRHGSPDEITIETSVDDGATWATWNSTGITSGVFNIPNNGKLLVRGDNGHYAVNSNDNAYWNFNCQDNLDLSGDLMTLIDSTGQTHTMVDNYCFAYLFNNFSTLTTDDLILSSTNISEYGLYSTFSGCSNIANPLDLSTVTEISDYGMEYTFYECYSMTTPPDFSNISNIGIGSLYKCFMDCRSLSTGPDFTLLTEIPVDALSQCFVRCYGLVRGADLSNVTRVGSSGLSLTYAQCGSIREVITPNITTWDTNIFSDWLYDVAESGVIFKPSALEIPTDSESGVPTGWTTQNY